MSSLRSPLGRHVASSAPTRDERRNAAREHWQMRLSNEANRFLFVWLDDVVSWPDRQHLENIGKQLYGQKGSK